MADLQGVDHSMYTKIDPFHFPEVLALVGRSNGQGELYVALKSSNRIVLHGKYDAVHAACNSNSNESLYHAEKRAEPKLAIMKEAAVAVRNQVIDMDGVPQPQQNKSRRT